MKKTPSLPFRVPAVRIVKTLTFVPLSFITILTGLYLFMPSSVHNNSSFQDNLKEKLFFIKRFIDDPKGIGAIAPSSEYLGKAIANHIVYKPGDYVIELGPGTGVFTQEILNKGVPEDKLILVELDHDMCAHLKKTFPNIKVIQGDATKLKDILPKEALGKINTIVSGIPLLNLDKKLRKSLVDGSLEALNSTGTFLQFTYGPSSPIDADHFSLNKERVEFVIRNIPPASVWKYSRKI